MPVINDGRRIERIVEGTSCGKHSASVGIPCWAVDGGTPGNFVVGVCGSRIREAGFNGKISPAAIRRK